MLTAVLALAAGLGHAADGPPRRLLIAFASFRDRPLHPRTYFYEHDGLASGKLAGGLPPADLRVDTHPSLSADGRLCVCASELENNLSQNRVFDRVAGQDVSPLPELNHPDGVQLGTTVSADGRWVAFAGWRRPGPAGWNLFLYDLPARKLAPLPVNTDEDEQAPTLSGDGRLIAFVVNQRPGGAGRSDIAVFDRQTERYLALALVNSAYRELDPALSADGRWLAFTSDRPGGVGARDVYVYDLRSGALAPLPGLNGLGHDQTPALSGDGRFLTFVAERVRGAGERDVYLYDRVAGRLLPTPELNSKAEEFDPCITEISPAKD